MQLFQFFVFLFPLISLGVSAANLHVREHYERLFHDWQQEHQISFSSGEEWVERLDIFAANVDMMITHNSQINTTWTMGLNKFSAMTGDEWLHLVVGDGLTFPRFEDNIYADYVPATSWGANPDSVDWRNKGVVTDVKDQAQCGSCWAFSATGALEGAYAQKTGKLVAFSEQQLVDCSDSYGNQGCNGGWPYQGIEYLKDFGGIASESSYPYKGVDGTCKSKIKVVPDSQPSGFTNIKDEDDLETAASDRPISVAIDVSTSLQMYQSGVYDGRCGTRLNHAVLVVGYGNDDSKDYWIVKNSWGASWGEKGYFRLAKGSNKCGIAMKAMYPSL